MKATVHLADPEEVLVLEMDARDRRAFELRGRKDLGLNPVGDLQSQIKAVSESWMAWCCWHAAVVRGGRSDLPATYAEWDARLVAVVPEDTGDEDPTGPAASAG